MVMKMAALVVKFELSNEEDNNNEYFERLELFLMAKGVEEGKIVYHMSSGIAARAYAVLRNIWACTGSKTVILQL